MFIGFIREKCRRQCGLNNLHLPTFQCIFSLLSRRIRCLWLFPKRNFGDWITLLCNLSFGLNIEIFQCTFSRTTIMYCVLGSLKMLFSIVLWTKEDGTWFWNLCEKMYMYLNVTRHYRSVPLNCVDIQVYIWFQLGFLFYLTNVFRRMHSSVSGSSYRLTKRFERFWFIFELLLHSYLLFVMTVIGYILC